MNTPNLHGAPVLVAGAGVMGTGIAQVAAQAGHRVDLFDVRGGAAAQARRALETAWDAAVAKGRLTAEAAASALARVTAVDTLHAARKPALVIEAVVEDLDVKRALFRQLEAAVPDDTVLATNTSSISVTALAAGLAAPRRVVGMHFFNPVPAMKLVEVISGLHTDPAIADAVFALCAAWGKVAVHARSTPGFIVNRIARPYYAETWALLQERAAAPEAIDACLRGAGFRMGPCALMDLIGHDVNFAVTQSMHRAFFGDKRYQPSVLQREMVDGGLLGRKSGRGFYDHREPAGPPGEPPASAAPATDPANPPPGGAAPVVHGRGALPEAWLRRLTDAGCNPQRADDGDFLGLTVGGTCLAMTDGRPATRLGLDRGVSEVAVFDWPAADATPRPALAYSVSALASPACARDAAHWLQALGHRPVQIADAPGLVVARTLSMIVNEAAEAVLQGVCSEADADAAMTLGVNYPAGPFAWLARWGAGRIVSTLDNLDAHYRGERYRASPSLRQRAWVEVPGQSAA